MLDTLGLIVGMTQFLYCMCIIFPKLCIPKTHLTWRSQVSDVDLYLWSSDLQVYMPEMVQKVGVQPSEALLWGLKGYVYTTDLTFSLCDSEQNLRKASINQAYCNDCGGNAWSLESDLDWNPVSPTCYLWSMGKLLKSFWAFVSSI